SAKTWSTEFLWEAVVMKDWDHMLHVAAFEDADEGEVQSCLNVSHAPELSRLSNVRRLSFATAQPTGCAV
ncbi:UNVERIFIED_CONTAM: hypothetical protein NY603_21835, partial [Bacteroidetes bacterium 56_B9]